MKKSVLVKSLVITFLSIIVGLCFYFDDRTKGALGKDEYLKRQSIRYDQFLIHPHISIMIIGTLFWGIILFGLYELICYVILKLIKKAETKGNSN
jgi:hypothetical protein